MMEWPLSGPCLAIRKNYRCDSYEKSGTSQGQGADEAAARQNAYDRAYPKCIANNGSNCDYMISFCVPNAFQKSTEKPAEKPTEKPERSRYPPPGTKCEVKYFVETSQVHRLNPGHPVTIDTGVVRETSKGPYISIRDGGQWLGYVEFDALRCTW